MLKELGRYNKIPKETLAGIKIPAKDTVVKYKLIGGHFDPISKKNVYPFYQQIPHFAEYYDENLKAPVEIGLVETVDMHGVATRIIKPGFNADDTRGFYHLQVGNMQNDMIYAFLELAPFVKGNQIAVNAEGDYLLEKIDEVGNAQREIEARKKQFGAITHATNLKDSEVLETAFLLGINTSREPDVIHNDVQKHAEKNPVDYLLRVKDPSAKEIALIARALHLKIANIDIANKSLRWSTGGLILSLMDTEEAKVKAEFAEFAKSEDGKKLVPMLKKLVDEKTAAANKEAKVTV